MRSGLTSSRTRADELEIPSVMATPRSEIPSGLLGLKNVAKLTDTRPPLGSGEVPSP